MTPDYKAAATALKGKVTVAAVNLNMLPEAKTIGDSLGITVLPTIRFVVSGDFLEFSGARTKDELVAFATKANEQAAKGVESRPAGETQPTAETAETSAKDAEATQEAQESSSQAPPESKIGLSKVNQKEKEGSPEAEQPAAAVAA